MVSSEDVRSETRRILGEANLDEASGKSIRVKVGEALQLSKEQSSSFRPIIEKEIADFLEQHEAGPLQATPASAKSSLEAREHPTTDERPAKQRKTSQEGALEFELSDNRKVSVREFKGKQLIDIREFYEKDGEQKPGSKGLALSQDQWQKLLAGLPSLSNALGTQEVGFSVDLGSNRLASVSSFKGSLGVDFREHYEKDGNLAPGKKGILLPLEQWESLCSAANEITSAAGSMPQSPVKTPVKASPGAKANSSAEKQNRTPGSTDVDAEFVDLGKLRRASVSEFKGRKLLNVREYYEKDGEARPGKKGISLTKDQADNLLSRLDDLSGALSQQQEISVALGPKRHAKVNKFKNTFLVDIREYYEKDEEEKPGAKGISLTADQWNILAPKLGGLVSSL